MPKIKPASANERRAFRKTLSPAQRLTFDELARLIDDSHQDLDWYHAVGQLTIALRPPTDEPDFHGSKWFVELAKALGPRQWLLHKAARFAELYPTKKAVRELEALGVDWTRLTLSFSVGDPEARHALLREAREADWTIPRLRFVLQERFPSARRGVGGRPRHTPAHCGAEVCLREMERLSRRLLDFYNHAWKDVKPAEWKQFVQGCVGSERDSLVDLLASRQGTVADLAAAGDDMRDRLTKLQRRI